MLAVASLLASSPAIAGGAQRKEAHTDRRVDEIPVAIQDGWQERSEQSFEMKGRLMETIVTTWIDWTKKFHGAMIAKDIEQRNVLPVKAEGDPNTEVDQVFVQITDPLLDILRQNGLEGGAEIILGSLRAHHERNLEGLNAEYDMFMKDLTDEEVRLGQMYAECIEIFKKELDAKLQDQIVQKTKMESLSGTAMMVGRTDEYPAAFLEAQAKARKDEEQMDSIRSMMAALEAGDPITQTFTAPDYSAEMVAAAPKAPVLAEMRRSLGEYITLIEGGDTQGAKAQIEAIFADNRVIAWSGSTIDAAGKLPQVIERQAEVRTMITQIEPRDEQEAAEKGTRAKLEEQKRVLIEESTALAAEALTAGLEAGRRSQIEARQGEITELLKQIDYKLKFLNEHEEKIIDWIVTQNKAEVEFGRQLILLARMDTGIIGEIKELVVKLEEQKRTLVEENTALGKEALTAGLEAGRRSQIEARQGEITELLERIDDEVKFLNRNSQQAEEGAVVTAEDIEEESEDTTIANPSPEEIEGNNLVAARQRISDYVSIARTLQSQSVAQQEGENGAATGNGSSQKGEMEMGAITVVGSGGGTRGGDIYGLRFRAHKNPLIVEVTSPVVQRMMDLALRQVAMDMSSWTLDWALEEGKHKDVERFTELKLRPLGAAQRFDKSLSRVEQAFDGDAPVMFVPAGSSGNYIASTDFTGVMDAFYARESRRTSLTANRAGLTMSLGLQLTGSIASSLVATGDGGRTCDEVPVSTTMSAPVLEADGVIKNSTVHEIATGICRDIGRAVTLPGAASAKKILYTPVSRAQVTDIPDGETWAIPSFSATMDLVRMDDVITDWAGVAVGEDYKLLWDNERPSLWIGSNAAKSLDRIERKGKKRRQKNDSSSAATEE